MGNQKILITGAAGFIGSNLTDQLLEKNYKVVGLDNFNDYYNPDFKRDNIKNALESDKFTLHEIDICSKDKLSKVISNSDAQTVVHLAARAGVRPSIENPQIYIDTNVGGTLNILETLKENNIENFIFASSSSVYGDRSQIPFSEDENIDSPVSPYAASKITAEKMIATWRELHGTKATIFRFFTVYGPKGRPDMAPYLFTENILIGKPITKYGDGSSSRDYTYIDDIVSGIITAVEKPLEFEIINLGNSHPVTLNEMIATLEKVTGKTAWINAKPKQQGDVEKTFASIEKAKNILNWSPSTPLDEGLHKFVDWFLQNRRI